MSCCGVFVMPVELPSRAEIPAARTQKPARPLTGRHVLIMIVAFFAVIAAVNVVMMVLAIRTMPGVQVRSAYEASQRFNGELDAVMAQDRRGWRVEVLTGRMAADGVLGVEIRDAGGQAVTGLGGEARLERPTDKRMDRAFALLERGNGQYEAKVPALEAGQWDLTVEFVQDHARVFVSRRRIALAK